jgi:hypothetical protein
MMKLRALFFAVVLCVIGGQAVLADSQVPFTLQASATSLTQPIFVGTHMFLTASGPASASHMGTSTFVAPHDFDLAAGTYVSDAFVTAANGDVLHIVSLGHFINAVDSVATWTIAGGTGRFAGATGSGTALNLNFGATITLTGTISTVGSIDG